MWLDCREKDCLWISKDANIGYDCVLITQSHDISDPPHSYGKLVGRKIIIDKFAFVFGHCLLYNCTIGEGAIVAAGSVLRGTRVLPYTMVAGNPAKEIKYFDKNTKKWMNV
jgi:acetyltransferase-like isoleucine patch superfamily enzyme